MSRKRTGLNKYQKRAFRIGEARINGENITRLLELSRSRDPEDRKTAANFLCPCHLRRRVEEAWRALYRMLEDPDQGVRKAAWHTLEDGGRPDDPALDDIFERAAEADSDRGIRHQAVNYLRARRGDTDLALRVKAQSAYPQRGKCDFCGRNDISVTTDFETEIPDDGRMRFSLVCEACAN